MFVIYSAAISLQMMAGDAVAICRLTPKFTSFNQKLGVSKFGKGLQMYGVPPHHNHFTTPKAFISQVVWSLTSYTDNGDKARGV